MPQTTGNEPNSGIKNLPAFIEAKRGDIAKSVAFQRAAIEKAKAKLEARKAELVKLLEEEELRLRKVEKESSATVAEPETVEAHIAEEPVAETKSASEPEETSLPAVEESAPAEEVSAETELPEKEVKVPSKDASSVKEEPKKQPASGEKTDKEKTDVSKQRLAAQSAAESMIISKPKKPVIKPVIKTYIPPIEEPRGSRYSRDRNGKGTVKGKAETSADILRRVSALEKMTSAQTQPGKDKKKGVVERNDEKVKTNRKAMTKKGYADDGAVVEYDEMGEIKKIRTRRTGAQKKEFSLSQEAQVIDHAVFTREQFTVKELAEKIGKTGSEIIKRLFQLDIMKTINDNIDFETAELVAADFGVSIELQKEETSEEKLISYFENESEDDPSLMKPRPPIVTIMGHVDHGKTSILDYIKKSNVAAGEAGGITQHISAYTTEVRGKQICFLDTPGHAAFTAMRARGADVTDIVVIVVAADDGVMPQTIEVINHCKAAGVKMVVAINKIDKTGADPDRVLSELAAQEIVPEEWGGDVPCVRVSAKTGENIDLLLENIMLVAEMMDLKANPDRKARGTVIEARLDKGKGPIAVVLVQNGTLKVGDHIVAGTVIGKVRAMQDEKGKLVKKALPSTAVAILGLDDVPESGDQLLAVDDEKLLKSVVADRIAKEKEKKLQSGRITLDDVFRGIEEGKLKDLNIIIKADVQGSVEALKQSLLELSTDEVRVRIPHAMVGAINESDVVLADSINAVIIGFNVRPIAGAKALAESKNVEIRLYRVIYDAIDEVTNAIKGLSAPKYKEEYLGKAEVRVIYKISGVGTIAGCMVLDGKIVKNAKVRLIRDNIVVADTAIDSLKRMKDNVKEVVQGYECGIGLLNCSDIKEGDIIESFEVVEDRS